MYAIIDCKIGVSSYSRYYLNIPSGTFSEQHYIAYALNLQRQPFLKKNLRTRRMMINTYRKEIITDK